MSTSIRNETPADYRTVEELTRDAFWNLFVPGCDEHYLVHIMRDHPDYLRELAFVAFDGDTIIGTIQYMQSHLADESGARLDTLTFGPLCVHPLRQRRGVGSALLEHSFSRIDTQRYKAVVIYGSPANYCRHGFKNGRDFLVRDPQGRYPYGLLVRELVPGTLAGKTWSFHASAAYELDQEACLVYDSGFPQRPREYRHTQEEFSIACRAYLDN